MAKCKPCAAPHPGLRAWWRHQDRGLGIGQPEDPLLPGMALQHNGQAAPAIRRCRCRPLRASPLPRASAWWRLYSYDNQTSTKDLGTVCTGKATAGACCCATPSWTSGEVELVVTATDRDGNTSEAASSVWVTRQGELWFGGEDHDRIDLLPEKKSYQVGETAKFQVRMPFRFATALVAVERGASSKPMCCSSMGQGSHGEPQVQSDWGPNVYVSVLALRGRLRGCPGTASSPGASRRRAVVERVAWYEGKGNTRPRQRWWICPSPPSAWGWLEIPRGQRPTRST